MRDEFRIDSHKLMFHPRTVAHWLDGDDIYPLYLELSPSGGCNHRCTFCALDYRGYVPRFLPTGILKGRIAELANLGLKSIMFGGEGEPLLHRDCADMISYARECGIDVALTTNGVLLDRVFAERAMTSLSWIKVSINAGTPATYARIHRARPEDFGTVLANLEAAAAFGRETGACCTVGAQMVLLPENAAEVELLASRCREAGMRYLVVKPYSQNRKSLTRQYEGVDYAAFLSMQERLESLSCESFRVIFRDSTMRKAACEEKEYGRCLALPFWVYVDSAGDVWGCGAWLGDDRFHYGNIKEQSFEEIWNGDKRRQSLEFVAEHLDLQECRTNCRMDEVNRYLWELIHPAPHVNFI